MNDAPPFSLRLITLGSGLFLSVLIWLSVAVPPAIPISPARAPLMPPAGLSAEAYVVRLAGDPLPIIAQRSGKQMAPASLTKLMTALIAQEQLAPDAPVVFSKSARAVEERRSDAADGEIFSRDDAVRMALMESDNDAARALAEAVGAKHEKAGFDERMAFFIQLMNQRAAEFGMREMHFENPAGLDAPDHTMSAEDIARLAEYIAAHDPALIAMTREREAAIFSLQGKKHTIQNTDDLLKEFPALAGGKTGFTDNAKGALLLLYPVRDTQRSTGVARPRVAIIVILKSDDRFDDGRKIIKFLEENFP